jgi:hypothetical protein
MTACTKSATTTSNEDEGHIGMRVLRTNRNVAAHIDHRIVEDRAVAFGNAVENFAQICNLRGIPISNFDELLLTYRIRGT